MNVLHRLFYRGCQWRLGGFGLLAASLAIALLGCGTPAEAGLVITPTFDSSITSLSNAAAIESAINAGIANIEANITSPNNVNASIYFDGTSGGVSSSETSGVPDVPYYQYYNALKAVATSPVQLTAIASLGPAPTSDSSPNPVNGSPYVLITFMEYENLFDITAPPSVGPGGAYNGLVTVGTDLTYTQTEATHEVDEILGIGGLGSQLTSNPNDFFPHGAVGPLDLFRYSAPGVRSYTTSTSATSYFSIDGGTTDIAGFSQVANIDYGDWDSALPRVQDAIFQGPATLGPAELTAYQVLGYQLTTVPEPGSFVLILSSLTLVSVHGRRRKRPVLVDSSHGEH